MKTLHQGPISEKSPLIQVKAWCEVNKSLHKALMIYPGAYMHHLANDACSIHMNLIVDRADFIQRYDLRHAKITLKILIAKYWLCRDNLISLSAHELKWPEQLQSNRMVPWQQLSDY